MERQRIVKVILDIGEAMLRSGAEVTRVADSISRMTKSYGFVRTDIFIIPSTIQITVEDRDGNIFTQIRQVIGSDTNYDRLDYLNNLSRYACANTPDAENLSIKLTEVFNRKAQTPLTRMMAGMMGCAGFAVFFNGSLADALVAAMAAILIIAIGDVLGRTENNVFVYNAILAFIGEAAIVMAQYFGMDIHLDSTTTGLVMLLVGGLATANGIIDVLHKEVLSGILNITGAILGAAGIAIGIAMALLMFRGVM